MGGRNVSVMKCTVLIIITLSLMGCVATSSHVKKGDVLLLKLAKEQDSALLPEITAHAQSPAGPQLPQIPDFLGELLAGSGGIAGLGFALYKTIQGRMKDKESANMMMALSEETDKAKCKDMLLKHPKIKV